MQFMGTLLGATAPGFLSFTGLTRAERFMAIAAFFCAWYIFSMLLLVYHYEERKESVDVAPTPIVPSMRRTFNIKPFRPLLLGWTLDYIAVAGIAVMAPFFVRCIKKK